MATTIADAIARYRADRIARGLPPTINDPAVLRIVASVLADAGANATGSPATTSVAGR